LTFIHEMSQMTQTYTKEQLKHAWPLSLPVLKHRLNPDLGPETQIGSSSDASVYDQDPGFEMAGVNRLCEQPFMAMDKGEYIVDVIQCTIRWLSFQY